MSKVKLQIRGFFQKPYTSKILLCLVTAVITVGSAIVIDKSGLAIVPDAAEITHLEGSTVSGRELTVRDEGNSGTITDAVRGTRLRRFRDVLGVPAGERRATLQFLFLNPLSFAGFRAQTVPRPNAAEYRLPCRTSGGEFTLSWRRAGEGRDRGCEWGVRVGSNSSSSSLNSLDPVQVSASSKQIPVSSRSILYCGARPRYFGLFQVSSGVTDDSCESVVRQCETLNRRGECILVSMGEWDTQEPVLHTALACSEGPLERRSTGALMAQLLLDLMQQSNNSNLSRCAINVYTPSDVIITPRDEQTLVQTRDTETGVILDVLIGEVIVRSARVRLGTPVRAGQRYSSSQNTTTPIKPRQLAQSPEIQNFLDPNQALSPGLPSEVAEDIAAQIADHRVALGLSPVQPLSSYYLRIVSGSGRITSSNVSAVRVGTSENRVSGGYDPSERKLLLDVAGRQVEITLNAPLTENTPVGFQVTRVRPRYTGESTVSHFQKLVENSLAILAPEGGGQLRRVGNQIIGDFTVRSIFIGGRFNIRGNDSRFTDASPPRQGSGLAAGEFRLNFEYSTSSNLPSVRD